MHPSPSLIIKTASCLSLMLFGVPVLLANSAVSEINGKIGVMHGSMDSESTTSLEGSITWPVQESFGIQLDGLYSTMNQQTYGFAPVDDEDLGGVGGHFFWRDSETFMLGVEAGYVFGDSVDSWELGLEAEFYYKWLTIGGKAGFASISNDRPTTSIETDKDAVFCQLYLAAYPVDNLLVAAFVENRFDNTYVSIEVEYELPIPGLSVFANAMKGEHGYDHAFAGMRYYFGEDKPLKSRHREDDPRNTLTGIRHGIGTWQAEIHEQVVDQAKQAAAAYSGSTVSSGSVGGALTTGSSTGSSIGGTGSIGGTLTIGGGNVLGPGSGGLVTNGSGTVTLTLNNSGLTATGTLTPILSGSGTTALTSSNSSGGALTPGGGTLVITPNNPGLTLGGPGSLGGNPVLISQTGTVTVHVGSGNIIHASGTTGSSTSTLSVVSSIATSDAISAIDWLMPHNQTISSTSRPILFNELDWSIPTSDTWGSSDGLIIMTPLGP